MWPSSTSLSMAMLATAEIVKEVHEQETRHAHEQAHMQEVDLQLIQQEEVSAAKAQQKFIIVSSHVEY